MGKNGKLKQNKTVKTEAYKKQLHEFSWIQKIDYCNMLTSSIPSVIKHQIEWSHFYRPRVTYSMCVNNITWKENKKGILSYLSNHVSLSVQGSKFLRFNSLHCKVFRI